MNEALMLENLKYDLQLLSDNQDSFLTALLETAYEDLERAGVRLTNSTSDSMLVVQYARYLYRKRRNDNPIMPQFLRYRINCRLIAQTGE